MEYGIRGHRPTFRHASKYRLAQCVSAASLAAALALASNSSIAQNRNLKANPWDGARDFITPIDPRLTVPDDDLRRRTACRGVPRGQCPQMLIWGGNAEGGLPTLDPAFGAETPHVRASFVLQRFQIVGPAEGNLLPEGPFEYEDMIAAAWWETHSPVASQELGNTSIYLQELSDPIDDDGYVRTPFVIYDALVLNSCNGFSSFPVSHVADFNPGAALTMPFEGYDDTTIASTGFYTFSYTVPVFDELEPGKQFGGLRMSGKVSVTCTGLNVLPMP